MLMNLLWKFHVTVTLYDTHELITLKIVIITLQITMSFVADTCAQVLFHVSNACYAGKASIIIDVRVISFQTLPISVV